MMLMVVVVRVPVEMVVAADRVVVVVNNLKISTQWLQDQKQLPS
jgi:hypothetical protein